MKIYQKKILGLALIGVMAFGFVLSGCQAKDSASQSVPKTIYQCSMHPQVISDKPGNCPICGMRLTKVENASAVPASAAKPQERKILFYRHPMQPEITSPVPSKDEMGMDFIPVYEEKRVGQSLPGHAGIMIGEAQRELIGMQTTVIEERPLTVKIRTLGRVGYDPDKFESIAEYQQAAAAYRTYKGSPYTQIKEKAAMVHDLAMLKLRLAGFSDQQIEGLMNTGQLVAHYSLEPDVHWLYADIYEYESQLIHVGDKAQIKASSKPGKIFSGTVRSVDTVLNASSRILRARIELEKSGEQLLAGATVDAEIYASLGVKLAIPEDAVVDTGEQKIAFAVLEDEGIEPREVQLGQEADGYYEVISGLKKGERVVSSALFLVDSESRLRAASQSFSQKSESSSPDQNAGSESQHEG